MAQLLSVNVGLPREIEWKGKTVRTADLTEKTVQAKDLTVPFEVDEYIRWRLLEGLDDIGLSLRHADAIDAFESRRRAAILWLPTAQRD